MSDYGEQAEWYLILIGGGPPSNYSAWSPDVPGCVATGTTVEEVEREMRAAIALHLEGLAADGESIPEPSGPGVYVERTAVGVRSHSPPRDDADDLEPAPGNLS